MKTVHYLSSILVVFLAGFETGCVAIEATDELDLQSSDEVAISTGMEVPRAGDLEALSRASGEDVSLVGCRWVFAQASYFSYAYGEIWHTPSMSTSSGCGHLYVQKYTSGCVTAYIRYFPSSGGSFTSGLQSVCHGSWAVFSTNVQAGTVFRVETPTSYAQFALDI